MAAMLGASARALAVLGGAPRALSYGRYFLYGDLWLLVRTSRIKKPFWGLRYGCVERFLDQPFALVLLTGAQQGWVLGKGEVLDHVANRRWPMSRDLEFKITAPACDAGRFETVDQLRSRLEALPA